MNSSNTEITDIDVEEKLRGWLLYDSDCSFCTSMATRFTSALHKRGFALLPLQTQWVRSRLNLSDADLLREIRLLKPDGTSVGGADALLELARYFWWAWPLVA